MTSQSNSTFDPAEVFAAFAMQEVGDAGFEAAVVNAPGDDLRCVFLWGQDCYNCNIFKQSAMHYRVALQALNLSWFHANVYADKAMGRRFMLHGVPTFMFYRSGKRLGKITGWPGLPAFTQAVSRLNTNPVAG